MEEVSDFITHVDQQYSNDLLWYSNHKDIQELQWFVIYGMRTAFYLLLKNCYDSYCCHGGTTNEHYFWADLTTVLALHFSHQSLDIYVNMLKINKIHVLMKVIQSHNHSSVTHISAHWCMCLLIIVSAVWCKKHGYQWRLSASVQWLNSWWKKNDSSAVSVMYMHWCHRYQKVGDMKYRWTWHTYLNMSRHDTCEKIQWLVIWIMMLKTSTKKWQVTAWNGMQSPNKKTGVVFWPAGL